MARARHEFDRKYMWGVANGSKHAVHWPDTPKFSDREDSEHRVGPLTPNGASPSRCDPSNLMPVPLGGDLARFADQSAIPEGGWPVAVPSGARAKSAHAAFLPMVGHAQRRGAGSAAQKASRGASRAPDHVYEGLHSGFRHVRSSNLHTCVGFRRRESNYAKKHVY
jgi:hypothetical protein